MPPDQQSDLVGEPASKLLGSAAVVSNLSTPLLQPKRLKQNSHDSQQVVHSPRNRPDSVLQAKSPADSRTLPPDHTSIIPPDQQSDVVTEPKTNVHHYSTSPWIPGYAKLSSLSESKQLQGSILKYCSKRDPEPPSAAQALAHAGCSRSLGQKLVPP